ncbi:hypothetical protein like AT2G34320 [Hibiscus trionum]|uniref:RNase H type-1 domain-containing protein n=1 Tax=Hibiscus trionum TaxID=183268 RepID=A0A9W7IR41_HIBTR|nr:hypothetical protein like AT2G34320 [Hibiscus trionum]
MVLSSPHFVKLNFDASLSRSERSACLGLVIRDEEGFILGAQCLSLNRVPSSFATEVLAAKNGIILSIELGFRKVVIEGDSLTVINKLKSKEVDFSEIGAITEDSRKLLRNLESYWLSFTRRGGNKVAHELAREQLNIAADQTWVEEAPERIEALAAEDRRCSDPP